MAAITGNSGSCAFSDGNTGAALDAYVTSWTATFNSDIHETTSWAVSNNAKTNISGLYDMTGSFEGFIDAGTTPPLDDLVTPASATLELTTTGVYSYGFSALLSSIQMDVTLGGVNSFTANFESTGVITIDVGE